MAFRALIDMAIAHGGRYYLAYHFLHVIAEYGAAMLATLVLLWLMPASHAAWRRVRG